MLIQSNANTLAPTNQVCPKLREQLRTQMIGRYNDSNLHVVVQAIRDFLGGLYGIKTQLVSYSFGKEKAKVFEFTFLKQCTYNGIKALYEKYVFSDIDTVESKRYIGYGTVGQCRATLTMNDNYNSFQVVMLWQHGKMTLDLTHLVNDYKLNYSTYIPVK